jgi:hypothetical protein
MAKAEDLPICDIADAFAPHSLEELVVNALDAHPNELANQLAARKAIDCVQI